MRKGYNNSESYKSKYKLTVLFSAHRPRVVFFFSFFFFTSFSFFSFFLQLYKRLYFLLRFFFLFFNNTNNKKKDKGWYGYSHWKWLNSKKNMSFFPNRILSSFFIMTSVIIRLFSYCWERKKAFQRYIFLKIE